MGKQYLSQESIDFIDLALGGISAKSWVFVLAKNNFTGAVHQFPIRRSELVSWLPTIETRYRSNYYVTANGFMGGKKRTEGNLFSLNNIVIDIDCHSKLRTPGLLDLRLDHLVHKITHDGVDEYGLLMPSAVVYTGRGIQLWWFHENLSARSNRWTWDKVGEHLKEILQKIISDNKSRDPAESFAGITVDMSASFSPAGVYRIPGTNNISAKCRATVSVISEHRYTLDELKEFNGEHKKAPLDKPFAGYKHGDCSKWAKKMLYAIRGLRMIRDNEIGAETRNNFCLVYYCMLVSAGFDLDQVEAALAAFNSEFKKPMSPQELKHTLTSARRKDYKISAKAMVKLLDITPEEESILHQCYQFNGQPKKKKVSKTSRYENALKEYRTGKYTVKELAKKIGISEPTIRKILRQNGEAGREERCRSRYEEIRFLKNQCGMPVPSIADKLNCSIRTVWRALKEYEQTMEPATEEAPLSQSNLCHERKKAPNNDYLFSTGDSLIPGSGPVPVAITQNRATPPRRRPISAASVASSSTSPSTQQHHPHPLQTISSFAPAIGPPCSSSNTSSIPPAFSHLLGVPLPISEDEAVLFF